MKDLHPPRWNHNSKDKTYLRESLMKLDYEILETDKKQGPIVLPRSWQHNEARRLLSDTEVYQPATPTICSGILLTLLEFIPNNKEFFLKFGSQKVFDGILAKTTAACTSVDPPWSRLRLLPKIHKLPAVSVEFLHLLKGRPIIGAHSCPSSFLSIFVDSILKPIANRAVQVLTDTKSFIRDLENLSILIPDPILCSADIASLYPNIPTDYGCRMVTIALLRSGFDRADIDFIVAALRLVLTANVFSFEGALHHQKRGTAMGTHLAPSYAILVLVTLEANSKFNRLDIIFFRRFIDDLFLIVCSFAILHSFFALYSGIQPAFQFERMEGKSVDFLNLTIFIGPNFENTHRLSFRPYAKACNRFLYLPFSSAHPMHMKKAFCKGLVHTLVINSSNEPIFMEALSSCYDHLRARGYPDSLLRPTLLSVPYSSRARLLAPKPPTDPCAQVFVLNLPYNAAFARIPVGKIVHEGWEEFISSSPASVQLRSTPVVAWSRGLNVRDFTNISARFVEKQRTKLGLPNY